jgi:hypothetical protein
MTTPGQIRGGYGERQIKTARCGAGLSQDAREDSAASYASAKWRFACASIVSLDGRWASVPRYPFCARWSAIIIGQNEARRQRPDFLHKIKLSDMRQ